MPCYEVSLQQRSSGEKKDDLAIAASYVITGTRDASQHPAVRLQAKLRSNKIIVLVKWWCSNSRVYSVENDLSHSSRK